MIVGKFICRIISGLLIDPRGFRLADLFLLTNGQCWRRGRHGLLAGDTLKHTTGACVRLCQIASNPQSELVVEGS